MEDVVRRLLAKAFLFDDPTAYAAGVEDAVEAIEQAGLTPLDQGPVAAPPSQALTAPVAGHRAAI